MSLLQAGKHHVQGQMCLVLIVFCGLSISGASPAEVCETDSTVTTITIDRSTLLDAVRAEMQLGYDPLATTNGGRFQGSVILRLVRWAQGNWPGRTRLALDHRTSFSALLEATGKTADEMPDYVKLAHMCGQDHIIDYCWDHVVKKVKSNRVPLLAVNVKAWWEPQGKPDKYSYHDTMSDPNLKVTTNRIVTYRLLDFGDMMVYDEVSGLSGRPTSGFLAVILSLVGSGK